MSKEVQSVSISQSDITRYGTVQRALITAINNCLSLKEERHAKVLISIKDDIDESYFKLVNAQLDWSDC